ncbi:MAG: PEP-CTERM sorting domain-containing protein [Armatimonadota bacterium]|nr:PEP-CTERM sorting domain-containing protein [Armatimonadota bacterium]
MYKFVVLTAVCAVAATASAQVLNFNQAPNNGLTASGTTLYMDVTDLSGIGLHVNAFDTYGSGTAGSAWNWSIYVKAGTYVGFMQASLGSWTLLGSYASTHNGSTTLATMDISSNPIVVAANSTVGVALQVTLGGIRYTGVGTTGGINTVSNADASAFSNHSQGTWQVSTPFTPRSFAGNVHYEVVPEPASFVALGLGIAILALRRRAR